jgi:hypothetical protein
MQSGSAAKSITYEAAQSFGMEQEWPPPGAPPAISAAFSPELSTGTGDNNIVFQNPERV